MGLSRHLTVYTLYLPLKLMLNLKLVVNPILMLVEHSIKVMLFIQGCIIDAGNISSPRCNGGGKILPGINDA